MIFKIFMLSGLFCIANEIGRVADMLEKITEKVVQGDGTKKRDCLW